MSAPTKADIIRAYRGLLRAGLRAVQFSKPARFAVRDQLRLAFRDDPDAAGWDRKAVQRTVYFLNGAARSRGLEHHILKNLLRVYWIRRERQARTPWSFALRAQDKVEEGLDTISGTEYEHYSRTIAMLNATMGIRLRSG